ncbi:MAG: hypothetical protein UX67_C0051G0006 [Candidatus Woesebacteria bacterium GW2011_GWF2_46_8]|uniref:Uncharacterized protein n=1 Tax=Candidatus Woesebacteria bacterium GW2011_GWF2_46_8 TaxID=1618604 RepID=A0A0G1SYM2_9BACT|nr:MAG: hypothetical protein UX67_C0051G0006 [Candidatus Woesebacteria bacterium GW2011_GWF2_46_8]
MTIEILSQQRVIGHDQEGDLEVGEVNPHLLKKNVLFQSSDYFFISLGLVMAMGSRILSISFLERIPFSRTISKGI